MATSVLPTLLSGSIFGTSLAVSGLFNPSTILDQVHLVDYQMLQTFLAASACSTILVTLANRRVGHAKLSHRTDSSWGWFGKYDANILGGLMQGISLTLTGACPGTVLVQMALGIKSGWMTALGCVLGAVCFVRFGSGLPRKSKDSTTSSRTRPSTTTNIATTTSPSPSLTATPPKHTIMQKANLSTSTVVLFYEIFILFALLTTSQLSKPSTRLPPEPNSHPDPHPHPIIGGSLVGLAQACSILLRNQTLGISGAWEETGKWILHFFSSDRSKRPGIGNLTLGLGAMLGALILSRVPFVSLSERFAPTSYPISSEPSLTPYRCVLGGFVMIFGARMAGGCTSGHGLSGMATMSVSSFVTVAAMLVGGVGMAFLL